MTLASEEAASSGRMRAAVFGAEPVSLPRGLRTDGRAHPREPDPLRTSASRVRPPEVWLLDVDDKRASRAACSGDPGLHYALGARRIAQILVLEG